MPLATFSGNSNYRLDHDTALQSQSQTGNYSRLYTRSIIEKLAGTGYAGSDNWYVRADSNLGAQWDLSNDSGGSWSFQNGSNSGSWQYGARTFDVPHDAAGNAAYWTLAEARFGNSVGTAKVETGWRNLPRIPKRPSPPGTPQFTDLLPTSMKVSWSASSDNGGKAVSSYLLRYWPNAEGTGSYIDHSSQNNTSRVVTGLIPGNWYRFRVYANNGSGDNGGYSNPSGDAVVRMLSGGRVRVAGVYKTAIPFIRDAGKYKTANPMVRLNGVYRNTL